MGNSPLLAAQLPYQGKEVLILLKDGAPWYYYVAEGPLKGKTLCHGKGSAGQSIFVELGPGSMVEGIYAVTLSGAPGAKIA